MSKKVRAWISEEIKDFLTHNNVDVPSLSVMRLTDKIGDLVDLKVKKIFDDLYPIMQWDDLPEDKIDCLCDYDEFQKIKKKHLGTFSKPTRSSSKNHKKEMRVAVSISRKENRLRGSK